MIDLVTNINGKICEYLSRQKEQAIRDRIPPVEEVHDWARKHDVHFAKNVTLDNIEWLYIDGEKTDEFEVKIENYPLRVVVEWRKLKP